MTPANDIMVDLDQQPGIGEPTFEMQGDNVIPFKQPEAMPTDDHGQNLAEVLDASYLTELGAKIVQQVEDDIEDRAPWRDRFRRGLELMGLTESDIDDGPFPGASTAVHPLLLEAVIQFWARTMGILFPAEGPVKAKVPGAQTGERMERGKRIAEYMNYEMTTLDEGYMSEVSRLIWAVGFIGCGFKKTFRDPLMDRNIGIYVPAEDFIVPGEATDLKTSSRFTHRMRKSMNDIRMLQSIGYYRKDVDLTTTPMEEPDEVLELKRETQDILVGSDDDDIEPEIFETCILLSIPGMERTDPETGEVTEIEDSYIVTVDRHSQQVLSIYRGWDEQDELRRRKVYFEKYGFVPGFGYYDLGLLHLIGGIQQASTGALRVLLDGAASASLSGGFVSKNANLKGQRLISTPGEWQAVDATSEDLAKAFFPLPVKEPSQALFQLLGFLVNAGQKLVATTDLMTGGEDPKGSPVGTTVAMIEQGSQVMSTIHRMMHASLSRELRLRFQLCKEYAPTEGYPYDVDGQERTVYADDFADGVGVTPVSDPNIFSTAQALEIARTVYQIAMESQAIPVAKATKRLLQAMRVPDIDELMPEDPQPMPYDPVGEVQAMLLGKPIQVMPEQDHVSHLKHLWSFAQNPEYGGNEQVMAQIGPQVMATIAQHMAYAWATHNRGLGVPAGYMDPQSGEQQQPNVPPEMIAQMAAQIAPQMAQVPGLPAVDPEGKDKDGGVEAEMAKVQIKAQESQQKMALEREKHQQDMQMRMEEMQAKMQEMELKLNAKIQETQLNAEIKQSEAVMNQQNLQQKAAMEQEQMQRDAVLQEQQSAQQMQMNQQKMDMDQLTMQQEGQLRQQQAAQDMQINAQKASQPPGSEGV